MINWTLFSKEKPPIDKKDKWNEEMEASPRLLVGLVTKQTKTKHITFGQYYHKTENWSLEGFRGDHTVIGWSELNEPELDTWANASKT